MFFFNIYCNLPTTCDIILSIVIVDGGVAWNLQEFGIEQHCCIRIVSVKVTNIFDLSDALPM